MKLSIIMPTHNEGGEFIEETLESIRSTIDVDYEVIIVDDYSEVPLIVKGAKMLRHSENRGVGAAFDTGVREAQSEYLFLMGCDVRFIANNWASKMIKEIEDHPRSLICTSVVHLGEGMPDLTFEMSRQNFVYNGATLLTVYGKEEMNILHAEWYPRESRLVKNGTALAEKMLAPYGVIPSDTQSYEIACILGAAYGVSRSWYNYIDGWWGHRKWGTLEPYISLKSWLFGGSCLTAPHIETAHIFKYEGKHGTGYEYMAYNVMLICWLLMDMEDRRWFLRHLREHPWVTRAREMIEENILDIYDKRKQYKAKTVLPLSELCKRFKLNY